ncbi:hypothetical protein C8J56DRAFT_284706 [Mycena floridula]|nr:hypothetical protein C8J56DRAFT_284706 [Mycena floridula]
MHPRPILKASSQPSKRSNAVHFPPSPALTQFHETHSSTMYDRSSIVVTSNNPCALPARGCPGRTYYDGLPRGHPHPRAFAQPAPVPALIPDLSSESEESDGFLSPGFASPRLTSFPVYDSKYPSSYTPMSQYDTRTRSIYPNYSPSSYPPPVSIPPPKRRTRNSSPRPYGHEEEDSGYLEDTDVPPSSYTPPKRTSRRSSTSPSSLTKTVTGFGFQSDRDEFGCLGGF